MRSLIEIEIMKKEPNRNSGTEKYKEMKNATVIINNRMDQAEKRNCEKEDRNFEFILSEHNKGKSDKKLNLCELWDTIESPNLQITGVPATEERWKRAESLFKEMVTENCSNLGGRFGYPSS